MNELDNKSSMRSLGANNTGCDYIVGDIHGEFDRLDDLLSLVSFNEYNDRLICSGDLVDRGAASQRVTEFLAKPWFYSVKGNHDDMAAKALLGRFSNPVLLQYWLGSGGDWVWGVNDDDLLNEIGSTLAELPVLIEIDTPNGLVGVCHGEPSVGRSWNEIKKAVQAECEFTIQEVMWSRSRIRHLEARSDNRLSRPAVNIFSKPKDLSIHGIEWVITGHTPHKSVSKLANMFYADTGACFGGDMMFVKINDTEGFYAISQYQRTRVEISDWQSSNLLARETCL